MQQKDTFYNHEVTVNFSFDPEDDARARPVFKNGSETLLTSVRAVADILTGKLRKISYSGFYMKQDGTPGRRPSSAFMAYLNDVDEKTGAAILAAIEDAREREFERLREIVRVED